MLNQQQSTETNNIHKRERRRKKKEQISCVAFFVHNKCVSFSPKTKENKIFRVSQKKEKYFFFFLVGL